MKKHQFTLLALGCALVAGCPFNPPPPPASAVLEGDWEGTTVNGVALVVTFDDHGVITLIVATNDEGSATVNVNNATTELDGNAATIIIPVGDRTATYDATLSDDNNTLDGSITSEIEVGDGDLNIIIDAGDLTLTRMVEADCETDADCDDGVFCNGDETCVEGTCEDGAAPDCDDGMFCTGVETCNADTDMCESPGDPCDTAAGETCNEDTGMCDAAPPECTLDTDCAEGEVCTDGVCVTAPIVGDPVAGEAYYAAEGCGNCHGADATGPPSLVDASAQLIFDKLSGAVSHVGGTRDVTEQDAADVEAYIASIQ